MRQAWFLRFAAASAVFGVLVAMLGAGLIVSRQKTEQGSLDRVLSSTASEKAALLATELERLRALALLTARIPPFAELYADEGSQAAKIAAVAGPGREINEALAYLWSLYPDRIVAAGYVDVDGVENSRIRRGVAIPGTGLSRDVRAWPEFTQGLHTPEGQAWISRPILSSRAGVAVVAATTPVMVDGRRRAFVELELATSALGAVLSADADAATTISVVDDAGDVVSSDGRPTARLGGRPRAGLTSGHGWRYAVSVLPNSSIAGGHWYVVAAARARSALAVALAPTQSGILLLALVMFAAAGVGLRRAHAVARNELSDEQAARAQAEHRSRTDALTSLFNRRHAVDELTHELARTRQDRAGVGLLMFDIDHFKRVNDSRGHAGGDAVIVEVARRLQAGVREWDTVARIGGEEFLIIAPGLASEADVAELGDRIRRAVADRPVAVPRGMAVPVTASVGAVLVHSSDGSSEYAIDRADRALYAAKRRGRNQLCRFSQLDHLDIRAEQPECLHVAEAVSLTSAMRQGGSPTRGRAVAELAGAIARRLALTDEQILSATLGGWLCDVGEIVIPDAILAKTGALTDDEWDIVRAHPQAGADLLHRFPELAPARPVVRHHHERYDGTGYPDRLAGSRIPVEARVLAVADAFHAMTSKRPYRAALTGPQAIDELNRCAGTQFDPQVVTALTAELGKPATGPADTGHGSDRMTSAAAATLPF